MEKSLDEVISENIRREIEDSGKKKSDIAAAIGVKPATVSQYCSGRAQPGLATLSRLCRYLECSADDILNLNQPYDIRGRRSDILKN